MKLISSQKNAVGMAVMALPMIISSHASANVVDLVAIAHNNTGSGQTEMHILSGESNYQNFVVQQPTAMQQTNDDSLHLMADVEGDGIPDLVSIARNNTGSGGLEVHVLSGASNYQTFIQHYPTAMHYTDNGWQHLMAHLDGDGKPDLVSINHSATGSGKVELHTLSGGSNYQTFIQHLAIPQAYTGDNATYDMVDVDGDWFTDLVIILHGQTGSGKTEVHVLSGVSNYQTFIQHYATGLGATGTDFVFKMADINYDGKPDLVAIDHDGTGSGGTEIHALSGASNYQTFIRQQGTGLGYTGDDVTLTLATRTVGAGIFKVNAGEANVRTGPSTGHEIMGKVYSNQLYFTMPTPYGQWYKIWYDNREGWVEASYLLKANPQVWVTINSAEVNVRSGPGTGYGIVGVTSSPASYGVAGCSGDWTAIHYAGATRWVHSAYVASQGTTCAAPAPVNPGLPTSAAGFVQLPGSGTGFYSYTTSGKRWGTPTMVYGLMNASREWITNNPSYARVGIGNISLENGGYFYPHQSHQYGKNADINPVSNSGYDGPMAISYSNYSSYRTDVLMANYIKPHVGAYSVLFNDPAIYNKYSWVSYYSGHNDHFHISIP